jgi:hypothetical protein
MRPLPDRGRTGVAFGPRADVFARQSHGEARVGRDLSGLPAPVRVRAIGDERARGRDGHDLGRLDARKDHVRHRLRSGPHDRLSLSAEDPRAALSACRVVSWYRRLCWSRVQQRASTWCVWRLHGQERPRAGVPHLLRVVRAVDALSRGRRSWRPIVAKEHVRVAPGYRTRARRPNSQVRHRQRSHRVSWCELRRLCGLSPRRSRKAFQDRGARTGRVLVPRGSTGNRRAQLSATGDDPGPHDGRPARLPVSAAELADPDVRAAWHQAGEQAPGHLRLTLRQLALTVQ